MIKRKSKALLCAIASIGFINSIEIIHANAYNNSFSDTKGHWAEAEISKFNDLGYISGYEDKTFKPNNSVTRAEFVKILNNVFGLTKSSGCLLYTSNALCFISWYGFWYCRKHIPNNA